MPTDDANLDAELQALMAAGRKIEAIKRYRELTGVGLKEAKDAVEAVMQDSSLSSKDQGDMPFEAEILSFLQQGKKIAAIKLYREKTGVGLKEAKDFIEALAADQGITARSRSGCLGVVLFVAAVFLMIVVKSFAAEGIDPAIIYAFEKTGLLVTEANEHLITDIDRAKWEAAVREYRAKQEDESTEKEENEWF